MGEEKLAKFLQSNINEREHAHICEMVVPVRDAAITKVRKVL